MVTSPDDAHLILDRAFDAGVNLIDTADNYNAGLSEEIVGRWLSASPQRRDPVVLATKVYYPPVRWTSGAPGGEVPPGVGPNDRGLSARHIRMACDASLRRLGTDRIDLYQMHHVDRHVPLDEIWQAMEQLVAQGKVIYVGTSNHAGWHLARAAETAGARRLLGPVSEQSLYNLAQRSVELEVLPACEAYGLGFLAFSPLAEGALAGLGTDGIRRSHTLQRWPEARRQRVERYEKLCLDAGLAPSDVAIAWVASRPGVTSTILGPRTVAQLEAGLAASALTLDDDLLAALEDIFPGPGGPAPEAYAW